MSVIQAEINFCTQYKYVRQTMSRYSCKYCTWLYRNLLGIGLKENASLL